MPLFDVHVSETRIYKTTYTVEADSMKEATEKAEAGDTVDEAVATLKDVMHREVHGVKMRTDPP